MLSHAFFRAPARVLRVSLSSSPRRTTRREKSGRLSHDGGGWLRYCDIASSSSLTCRSLLRRVEVTGRRRERSRTKEQTQPGAEWRGEKVNGFPRLRKNRLRNFAVRYRWRGQIERVKVFPCSMIRGEEPRSFEKKTGRGRERAIISMAHCARRQVTKGRSGNKEKR